MVIIVSFDCGHKHLGVCILKKENVSTQQFVGFQYKKNSVDFSGISLVHLGVYDVLNGSKLSETNAIERTRGVKLTLKKVREMLPVGENVKVLCEFQMNVNDKSREIQHQILYEFCDFEVDISNTGNAANFSLENGKKIGDFFATKTAYNARKLYSSYIFSEILSKVFQTTPENAVLFSGNKTSKKFDDIADATLQALSFILSHCVNTESC